MCESRREPGAEREPREPSGGAAILAHHHKSKRASPFGGDMMTDEMVNLNEDSNSGVPRPNGGPSQSAYPDRWLHSDMKDVSYFFNFMFFRKVI